MNISALILFLYLLVARTSGFAALSSSKNVLPKAIVQGYLAPSDLKDAIAALQRANFDTSLINNDGEVDAVTGSSSTRIYQYSYVRATGMLKLLSSPTPTTTTNTAGDNNEGSKDNSVSGRAPSWIPIISDMEHMLVQNGWSFLDPDESEPLSAFDVDAANEEGLYKPKWGQQQPLLSEQPSSSSSTNGIFPKKSTLGYTLKPWTKDQVVQQADQLANAQTRRVLLEGATDEPHIKKTQNGHDFSGSVRDLLDQKPEGVFVCAIGGLPLFELGNLSPSTASSGWLSFSGPISEDHVVLVRPSSAATDQRVEVVCARTGCHIGHYFGKGGGYCINASALDYITKQQAGMESNKNNDGTVETMLLGAGCFWHVEYGLRQLEGVVSTQVGYAGGTVNSCAVLYEEVCQGQTGHAEVVQVSFDPTQISPTILLDCFLAMHDPTKTRAHGKHAKGCGQYRSCILVENSELQASAQQCVNACQAQLGKEICTEIIILSSISDGDSMSNGRIRFHVAEERHQRHDEKSKLQVSSSVTTVSKNEIDKLATQLDPVAWLAEYGKRSKSILGSAATIA